MVLSKPPCFTRTLPLPSSASSYSLSIRMSAGSQVFAAWKERIICPEKGRRVVHFYLKGSAANSILAVVGTERSIRHMVYVITEDFVDSYGIVSAGTKWRARRDVVEWLTELVSEFRQPSSISTMEFRCKVIPCLIYRPLLCFEN